MWMHKTEEYEVAQNYMKWLKFGIPKEQDLVR